jgi:hypothetical protein
MQPLPFAGAEVPRRPAPPVDEFSRQRPERPVILTGAMERYPLYEQLRDRSVAQQLASLQQIFATRPIYYSVIPRAARGHLRLDDSGTPTFPFISVANANFAELATRIERALADASADMVYMMSNPAKGWPELATLCPAAYSGKAERNIWIGSGGHVVDLHYDWWINFLYLFAGTKRVTLFPPEALPHLYPAPLDKLLAGTPVSLVTLLDNDRQKFPRLDRALELAHVALLQPGDVLTIPPMWWHHVESFGFNVMINTWVADTVELPKAADWFAASLATFAELPPRLRSLVRDLYFTYVFRVPYEPRFATDHDNSYVPRARDLEKISAGIVEATLAFSNLPVQWRSFMATLFDYFICRTYGDPYPTLPPGTDAAVTRRLALKHIVNG